MRGTAAAVGLGCLLVLPQAAAAQDFPPVTESNFTIDLYQGAVLGGTRIIGMGGAQVAMAEGAAGLAANPASPAVRPATSTGTWDWDWNVDWLNPQIGTDYDNNGVDTDEGSVDRTIIITGGLVVNYREWALGMNLGVQQFDVVKVDPMGGDETFQPEFLIGHFSVSRTFLDDRVAAAVGIRVGTFSLTRIEPERTALIEMTGSALELGGVWMPKDRNLRVGASGALAADTQNIRPVGCDDPMDCEGFILPERVEVPWQIAGGVAWRRAATRWNKKVDARWRDERALLLAADVVVTGPVKDGHGIEQYVIENQLQRSGKTAVVSVRGGAEYEWFPGKFRVRGGSYWEPSRFDGVSGRLHVTLGLDWRIWRFCFWDERYRLRLSLTADGADKYGNGGLSIGLWH